MQKKWLRNVGECPELGMKSLEIWVGEINAKTRIELCPILEASVSLICERDVNISSFEVVAMAYRIYIRYIGMVLFLDDFSERK